MRAMEIQFFDERLAHSDAQFLQVAAPLAKFGHCSRIGKICPPATALPNSPQGKKYMTNHCIIVGGSGGGVLTTYIIGMSAQLCFWFVFGSVGKPVALFLWGETARSQIGLCQKIRVNPNYQVVFLLLPHLLQRFPNTTSLGCLHESVHR
jgi:hypothetical protein